MRRRQLHLLLATGAALLLSAATSVANPPPIQKNPFTRPSSEVIVDDRSPIPVDSVSPGAIDLRATLVASQESLANVAGKVLRPGDVVQGYQLIRVFEDRAVFGYQGKELIIYVRPQMDENYD